MVVVPAWVWRGGAVARAVTIGLPVGLVLGLVAFADSGMPLSGAVVFVVVGPVYGIVMARRMSRFWPGAKGLSGADRVTVARATRRGDDVTEPRLAPAVIDYADGLRAAAEQARSYRWLMWLLLVVSLAVAVLDAFVGTILNGVVSWLFVVFFVVEMWWWPQIQAHLLANADRARARARQLLG
ncbi:MAG: hypothetical protein JO152_08955 [Mycobacteriaceae bacterium]|nr:hypothetical protein [Mycobacteriaceae bacterium]